MLMRRCACVVSMSLGLVTGCLLAVPPAAHAAVTLDIVASALDDQGRVIDERMTRLIEGVDLAGEAVVRLDEESPPLVVRGHGTFDRESIGDYVAQIPEGVPPFDGPLVKAVNWVTKTTVLVELPDGGKGGKTVFTQTHERSGELFAAFAIAPDSASFTGSGDLDYQLFFVQPGPNPPILEFSGPVHLMVPEINLGHLLLIDLDALGVPVGGTYSFAQSVQLSGHVGFNLAFTLDPVAGTAVPEPASIALLALGGLLLLGRPGGGVQGRRVMV